MMSELDRLNSDNRYARDRSKVDQFINAGSPLRNAEAYLAERPLVESVVIAIRLGDRSWYALPALDHGQLKIVNYKLFHSGLRSAIGDRFFDKDKRLRFDHHIDLLNQDQDISFERPYYFEGVEGDRVITLQYNRFFGQRDSMGGQRSSDIRSWSVGRHYINSELINRIEEFGES